MISARPVFSLSHSCPTAWDTCNGVLDICAYLDVRGTLETYVSQAGKPPTKQSQPWSAKVLPQRYKIKFLRKKNSFGGCAIKWCPPSLKDTHSARQPWEVSDYMHEGPLQVEIGYKFQSNPMDETGPTEADDCISGRIVFHWIAGLFLISGTLTSGIQGAIATAGYVPLPNVAGGAGVTVGGGVAIGGYAYSLPVDYKICCRDGECRYTHLEETVTDAQRLYDAAAKPG